MKRVDWTDDEQNQEATIAFAFDMHNADELAAMAFLLREARSLVMRGSRLSIELAAHLAYCQALESGIRDGEAAPLASDAAKDGNG